MNDWWTGEDIMMDDFYYKNLREKTFSPLFELQGPSQKFHK